MILNFTVANLSICKKWLLITSHLPCTQDKKPRGSKWEKTAVHIAFWKFCTAAVHVDRAYIIYRKSCSEDDFFTLMKLRLDFLFTNFFSKIFSITYVLKFLNSWAWEEMIQIICDVKSDVICLHNRYGKSISIHNQNIRS